MPSAINKSQWANSGTGLMARIILTTNEIAYRADIASIAYEVRVNGIPQVPPDTGTLDPADVMLTELTAWGDEGVDVPDEIGKTFHWNAAGSHWSAVGTTYVIGITFTPLSGRGVAFTEYYHIPAVSGWT